MKQQVNKHQQGFSLIELMVVVAIAAILISIALPTYMDYLVRSKVAEMILAASPLRTAITESAQQKGSLSGSGAGLVVNNAPDYITSGSVSADGVITIYGSRIDLASDTDVTLTIEPVLAPSGVVTWNCSANAAAVKFMPPSCKL